MVHSEQKQNARKRAKYFIKYMEEAYQWRNPRIHKSHSGIDVCFPQRRHDCFVANFFYIGEYVTKKRRMLGEYRFYGISNILFHEAIVGTNTINVFLKAGMKMPSPTSVVVQIKNYHELVQGIRHTAKYFGEDVEYCNV